jgi:uncharacterized protein (TIGR02145 family)
MDRNLGASRVATSSTDHLAYGSLYQWGRGSDGHQLINWSNAYTGIPVNFITNVLSTTDAPGNSNFIITSGLPEDWRSGQNDNLWQGVNGINNPCPVGFRIPTRAEWVAEFASWSSQHAAGAFASPLKLTMAGIRTSDSQFNFSGGMGFYWSSSTNGTVSHFAGFDQMGAGTNNVNHRGMGFSVRCIMN